MLAKMIFFFGFFDVEREFGTQYTESFSGWLILRLSHADEFFDKKNC